MVKVGSHKHHKVTISQLCRSWSRGFPALAVMVKIRLEAVYWRASEANDTATKKKDAGGKGDDGGRKGQSVVEDGPGTRGKTA